MNYLQKKKLAYMSIVNRVKGFVRTITGALPLTLEGCVDEESIIDYTLYGQSVQNGTPTPETPIEVESVGEYDETTGKYKIPIIVSYGTRNITTNIYLDEPLRKVGEYADYIKSVDLVNGTGVAVRQICYERITTVQSKSVAKGTYPIYLTDINKKPLQYNNPTFTGYSPRGYAISDKFKQNNSYYSDLQRHLYFIQSYITQGGVNRVAYTLPSDVLTVAQAQEAIGDGFDAFYVLEEAEEERITLPTIPTFKGTSIISTDTTIQPSNVEITYYSNVKE